MPPKPENPKNAFDGFNAANKWANEYMHNASTPNIGGINWFWIIIIGLLLLIAVWWWWANYGTTKKTADTSTLNDLKDNSRSSLLLSSNGKVSS